MTAEGSDGLDLVIGLVHPSPVLDPQEVAVTPTAVARGYIEVPCPSCRGTGVAIWHPEYPDKQPDCIRCSTRGTVGVSV